LAAEARPSCSQAIVSSRGGTLRVRRQATQRPVPSSSATSQLQPQPVSAQRCQPGNAPEALAFYAQELIADGRQLPPPRTLDELKADPDVADDLGKHTVALIEWPPLTEATE
jgi:hypothetical protein